MPDGHSVSEVGIEAADVACNAPLDIVNRQSRPEEVIARTHLEPMFRRLFTQLVDLLQCHVGLQQGLEIGRASCRERVC